MDCLDANAIQDLMSGALDSEARAAAIAHLDTCEECRDMVSLLAKDAARDVAIETLRDPPPQIAETLRARRRTLEPVITAPTARRPRPASGSHARTLGRYALVQRLGAGAMGIVYRATDPELGRDVALKLLHVPDDELTERLVREARSMAKVNHPNVVGVHEVGADGDSTFIVMELVEGTSLRVWLQTPRTIPEILEKFLAAGRGLAAAHAAGVIHRDFKPDNVLVGADGRVCVTDFGLAAFAAKPEAPPSGSASLSSPDLVLTQSGSVLGTPAYMAPEQYTGAHVDARTDQYAFCITLYEALYGQRPYAGKSFEDLGDNVCEGRMRPLPAGTRVLSSTLRRIVLRGLSIRPGDRFPTMDHLLAELGRDRAKPWRRVSIGSTVLAAVIALGIGADFVVRDRVSDEIAQSFAATGVQTNRAFRLLVQQFDANAKQMYYQKAIVDLGGLRDETEFGLGNPEDEAQKREEIHDQLASTDWSVWRQGIGSSLVIAVADDQGRLFYTSADEKQWQTNVLDVPWLKAAATSGAARTILARTDDAALAKTGLLGARPAGSLGFFYVRPRAVNDEITSYIVQALDAVQLIPEIQLDDEMQLSIVAPDGTHVGAVPEALARRAPERGTVEIDDDYLVRAHPLTDRDGNAVGRVVMARQLDGVISGFFPGARLVFAAALAAAIGVAIATFVRARRIAEGR